MANNLIQIKRSTTTAVPASLANGEFAITSNGDVLYIGSNGAVVPIAGKRVPGVLTANQALVANATSGIDKIIVANAAVSQLNANGATGTAGQVLKSAGPGANSYWGDLSAGVAGSDTQVQFNDAGNLAGDAGLTYNKTTDTLTVAGAVNVGANVIVNTTVVFVGNSTVNADISSSIIQVANSTSTANLVASGLKTFTNSTVNSTVTASLVQVSNSTSTANLTAADLKIGATTVVNSTQVTATLLVGNVSGSYANITGQVNTATLYAATSANIASVVQANSTGIWTTATANALNFTAGGGFGAAGVGATVNSGTIGISSNTTVNASATASLVQVANSTGNVQHSATSILAQTNTTVNATLTSAKLQISNSTSTANLTALDLTIGTTVANSTALKVGNTTITTTNAVFGGTIAANGGIGSAGQVLMSAAAGNAYWQTIGNGTVTSVASGNGITGGTITSTGTLYAVGANGISVTTAGINVLANSGLVSNSTGVFVLANSGIVSNSTGVFVNANTTGGLSVNTTLQVKVAPSIVFDGTGNLAVNTAALSFTDLTVSGNLTVLGDLVSLNVATLSVEDSLITLAKDQASTTTYTDAVDVGFIAPYGNTAAANANWTGLFRDQSDSGVYKLFSGNIPAPTTTVDTTNVNFAYATLQTQLKTGGAGATGLIANATHIAITANSTLNVAITANTLSLTTALPTTSGGTGTGTYAVGDILVGNTSNALTKLAAGADGYVLQINGTGVVAWNTLDGGTF